MLEKAVFENIVNLNDKFLVILYNFVQDALVVHR